jgi:phytoene dehydrogenase-like protein
VLVSEVAERFPSEADRFARFVDCVRSYDDTRLDVPYTATRPVLRDRLGDPLLIEMLLCPTMYYGSAEEHDMDFTQFVTLFKSILLEGMARPREGVRRIIKALVRKYRACGGELRMRCGVERLRQEGDRVAAIILDTGETITADKVLSCAGYCETMRLCEDAGLPIDNRQSTIDHSPGRLSFVETVAALDCQPAHLGHHATIVFFNDEERFTYARPEGLVDLRSGVFCCPTNYQGHEDAEGSIRLTWLANHEEWSQLNEGDYTAAKRRLHGDFLVRAERFISGVRGHVVCTDMFTPVTIRRYTGHLAGAVYGSPRKRRDGRTPLENLFICGTDQGYLGIIGAMLSGITVANLHVLGRE